MRVCVIQPQYSFDGGEVEQRFADLLALLDRCDDSLDLIVLPEYSDAPADVQGKTDFTARWRTTPSCCCKRRATRRGAVMRRFL